MIKMAISFTGMMGRIKKGTAGDWVKAQVRTIVEDATREWITRKGSPSLAARTEPSAFSVYGMKHRSKEYEKEQVRANGSAQPYASPRRYNYARLAGAITKGNAIEFLRASRELSRLMTTPMRKAITRTGGYALRVSGGAGKIKTSISLPGARVLNRGGAKNAIYRRELLDMSKGGRRDQIWITTRIRQLMVERIWNASEGPNGSASVTGLRGLKRALRKIA
jgi:hypothetical protein